jgi:hypothetical protein
MVVHELDILGASFRPAKTDAELIIDANAPLTGPVALQGLETIAGRSTQVVDSPGKIELLEFA